MSATTTPVDAPSTPADIEALLAEAAEYLSGRQHRPTRMVRSLSVALAAEQARADEMQRRLTEVLAYAESTYSASTVARTIVRMGKAAQDEPRAARADEGSQR